MNYDVIIIGAGVSGLFAGASCPRPLRGLIIEKTNACGKKLLMSGGGQCNVTQAGSIKEFVKHYGPNGNAIRSLLYKYSNTHMMDFFAQSGVKLWAREDGKVFPASMDAKEIRDCLVTRCEKNGFTFLYSHSVTQIVAHDHCNNGDNQSVDRYTITVTDTTSSKVQVFTAKSIIVACGGKSYPTTGSDGSIIEVLEKLGITIAPMRPALTPIYVHQYPYASISGIAIRGTKITVGQKNHIIGDVLFTHHCFSGPGILDISRYVQSDDNISLNYISKLNTEELLNRLVKITTGNNKEIATVLLDEFKEVLPKRFIEIVLERLGYGKNQKSSQLSKIQLKNVVSMLSNDTFKVSKVGDYAIAMATTGGVHLSDVDMKNCELKQYEGFHVIGELLDIDGDTGGYNIQLGFSTGVAAINRAVSHI